MARRYPNVVIRRNVVNQSSRNGVRPDLIVLHSTESHNRPGSADLGAIGAWFDNPSAQASAHICTDADGNSARYVGDAAKAWACVNFNSRSINIEQIGQAAQGKWSRAELKETARWLAHLSHKHGIPLRRSDGSRPGVTRHMDLGIQGGGHHDPGPGFPIDRVLRYARRYKLVQTRRKR
jgi:N-acetyl-anhydromuramyl-L-alanine amidase AmpD